MLAEGHDFITVHVRKTLDGVRQTHVVVSFHDNEEPSQVTVFRDGHTVASGRRVDNAIVAQHIQHAIDTFRGPASVRRTLKGVTRNFRTAIGQSSR